MTDLYGQAGSHPDMRSRDRFTRFFDGLEVVTPGRVTAEKWHPELGEPVPRQECVRSGAYVAVTCKGRAQCERPAGCRARDRPRTGHASCAAGPGDPEGRSGDALQGRTQWLW